MSRPSGLGAIFLVLFVDLIGFSLVFPLFPGMLEWYAAQPEGLLAQLMRPVDALFPGVDPWQRAALFGGLLGAAYAALQFIAAPMWGRLSDRHGRRPILLISLSGSFLSNLIWMFSGDFAVLLLSRLLAGAMTGNIAVANAAVADVTTAENRSRGMAAVGMAFGLGFILGPALGGQLAAIRLDQALPALVPYGLNPFSTPAAFAAALAGLNLLWVALSFRETLPPERRGQADNQRSLNPLLIFRNDLPPKVHAVNLSFFAHTLLFGGLEMTLGFLAAQELGLGFGAIGLMFAGMGLGSAAVQGALVRPHGERIGMHRLAQAGFALHILGFILLALIPLHPSMALLVAGIAVNAVATGLVFPSLATLVSLAAPPERQGFAMGTFRSASSLGRAIGPLVLAVAYFAAPSAPYWLGAAGMLVPLMLVRRMARAH
ncbi:MAG: MFS transporter [Planctomycetes bacterium]|nr:MFS transporter [Planctomycetota bacterium]